METAQRNSDSVEQSTSSTPAMTDEATEVQPNRSWHAVFKEALRKTQRSEKPVATRGELGRDRTKTLVLLAGSAVALLLLFFGVFSTSNKSTGRISSKQPGAPNLGRKDTPGTQPEEQGKSVTPLLSADLRSTDSPFQGQVTPEEIERSAGITRETHAPKRNMGDGIDRPSNSPYALRQIDVPPAALPPSAPPQPASSPDLRAASLVFVRSLHTGGPVAGSAATTAPEQSFFSPFLPAGTRLIARLEVPASSATHAPVVAVVEYSYERDGEIVVPVGTKAFGKMEAVNSSGFVGLRFDALELPDGTNAKIDASAMDLGFRPLKGHVTGKNAGKKFLVTSLTGLGTAAAYLVGPSGGNGFNGPISESDLLRERIANNIGNAGNEQLSTLAYKQNVVVTVPANTRFYLVFDKATAGVDPGKITQPTNSSLAQSNTNSRVPSLEELRQLLQLRQELGQLYEQSTGGSNGQSLSQQ